MILYTILLVIHSLICVALVLVILSQTSKGGLDANLGGAAMNVFGGSGASAFLRKTTQVLGIVFLASCLMLAFLIKNVKSDALKDIKKKQQKIKTEQPSKPIKK